MQDSQKSSVVARSFSLSWRNAGEQPGVQEPMRIRSATTTGAPAVEKARNNVRQKASGQSTHHFDFLHYFLSVVFSPTHSLTSTTILTFSFLGLLCRRRLYLFMWRAAWAWSKCIQASLEPCIDMRVTKRVKEPHETAWLHMSHFFLPNWICSTFIFKQASARLPLLREPSYQLVGCFW